jgi:hypothetical protein
VLTAAGGASLYICASADRSRATEIGVIVDKAYGLGGAVESNEDQGVIPLCPNFSAALGIWTTQGARLWLRPSQLFRGEGPPIGEVAAEACAEGASEFAAGVLRWN